MNLKPAEVAMRQFSRTLFGANPAEVREFLLAAAASLERVNDEAAGVILERTALQTAVKHANAEVETLRAKLAEVENRLAAYRGQEALLGRAVLDAKRVTEELTRSSREQAERTIAQANATAKEAVETARQSAADLLRAARAHAQQAVEAAERAAAARISEVQVEAERLTAEVRRAATDIRQAAQHQIETFVARLEAFLANREELAGNLDALAKHHADSLEAIGRLHAEVERVVIPTLRELTQTVTQKEPAARGRPVSVPPAAPAAASPAPVPVRDASRDHERNGGHPPALPPTAEIVMSPVHSYLQATKLVTAVSRLKGVTTARLRSYSKGAITIDVVTETGTVGAIDPSLINGGPLDVVEATDSRIVLRLGDVGSGRGAGSSRRV
jgi:cell division septum initiation protein DivIVA